MTGNKNNEKKISSLRAFDKREAQRKSLKEAEQEAAAHHYEIVSPKIYYEDNEVNDIHIWLDMLDHYCTIYIGPFISKDGKDSHIGLRYTIDSSNHGNISNDPKDEIISDWTIDDYEKISVKHNKLNTGIMIQKVFDIKVGNYDKKLEKSLYIPMSSIFHIVTNENPYNKDIIEK